MPVFRFATKQGNIKVLPFINASTVETEWSCPLSGRRADIALLAESGQPVLLVEVFHTNAVDENKRLDISKHWWIEVSANDVIEDPEELAILAWGNLPRQLQVVDLEFKQVHLF